MNADLMTALMNLVERKRQIDLDNEWYEGAITYATELRKEITEAEGEFNSGPVGMLEDELGDVLWDYLNLVRCLVDERGVSVDAIFTRAVQKYDERISGIEKGMSWTEIKTQQQARQARVNTDSDSDGSA